MSIDVTEAVRNESLIICFAEALDIERVEYPLGDFVMAEPVRAEGAISVMGNQAIVKGELIVTLSQSCDRCGEALVRTYNIPFDEVYTRGYVDSSPDAYSFDGESIDLTRMIEDCIMLQIPTATLCREDCKGLCPVCGVNLNRVQCRCNPKLQSSPFAALLGLELDKEE